ncbi:MAG TPA: DUF2785 domain-containing protein [Ktedonobacterales bacterium]|jgi:hypothetical protein
MDKSYWQAIVDAEYAVPANRSVAELTPELLSMLGSSDPHLRDKYAYPILAIWLSKGLYNLQETRAMTLQLLSNLSMGLGEQGTDTVFLRAFSALMLAEVVHQDNKRSFLNESDVRHILEQALAYYPAERDLRGYLPGPGWAHAVAHGADLLWVLSASRYLEAADLERVLDALASKIAPPAAHVYLFNEDQRMVRATLGVLRRDLLSTDYFKGWLELLTNHEGHRVSIEKFLDGEPPMIASEVNVSLLHNTRQFLSALYLHLTTDEDPPANSGDLALLVLESLKPMNTW